MAHRELLELQEETKKITQRINQLIENSKKIETHPFYCPGLDNKEPKETKLEVGKWYKTNHGCLFNYNGNIDKENDPCGYGFSMSGKWFEIDNSDDGGWESNPTPSTDQEVEAALIKEAKKRGFEEAKNIKSITFEGKTMELSKASEFQFKDGELRRWELSGGYVVIFYKGKWATIIEDQKPKICGYEMEEKEMDGIKYVKFGCEIFDTGDVRRFYDSAVKLGIKSFTIFGAGPSDQYEIGISELKEVVEYLIK
jgi:hypothetical protein